MPLSGDKFTSEEAVAAVESVKTSAEVYSPTDMEITGINEELESRPELVNEDPEGSGWISEFKFTEKDTLGTTNPQPNFL